MIVFFIFVLFCFWYHHSNAMRLRLFGSAIRSTRATPVSRRKQAELHHTVFLRNARRGKPTILLSLLLNPNTILTVSFFLIPATANPNINTKVLAAGGGGVCLSSGCRRTHLGRMRRGASRTPRGCARSSRGGSRSRWRRATPPKSRKVPWCRLRFILLCFVLFLFCFVLFLFLFCFGCVSCGWLGCQLG
jgi:hypothetical protein